MTAEIERAKDRIRFMAGSPRAGGEEISPERILLGRLALLSREGNHRAVAEMLAGYLDQQMLPTSESDTGIRENRRDKHSDPLTLPMCELNLEARLVNTLEQYCGVLYVGDLDKWPTEELLGIPGISRTSIRKLREAIEAVGAWDKLQKRRHVYRVSILPTDR